MTDKSDFQLAPSGPVERRNINSQELDTLDTHEHQRNDLLTTIEMEQLLEAARKTRLGQRNYCMLLLMCRHALHVDELVDMRLSDMCLDEARMFVRRRKHGLSTSKTLQPDELRALRVYLQRREDNLPWIFVTEQKGKLTRKVVNYLVEKIGETAGFQGLRPHVLCHSLNHRLAYDDTDTRLLQEWLVHRDKHFANCPVKRLVMKML